MAENIIPRIPKSNSLQFIRYEDRNDLQTDFNRQYGDYEYFNRYTIDYCQKYLTTSDLWFEWRSKYLNHSVILYDEAGSETALTIDTGSTYDDYTYYRCTIPTSLLDGVYYVSLITDQDADKIVNHFTSNYFEVRASYDNILHLEWHGNGSYSDGMDWGTRTQELIIEGQLLDSIPASDIVTTRDDNGNLEKLNSYIYYKKKLQIRLVPEYMVHLLDIAVSHETFVINGQVWTSEGTFDSGDRLGYSQMYVPAIELELKDYENYAEDRTATGDLPILPETSVAFDAVDSLAFDSVDSLKFS